MKNVDEIILTYKKLYFEKVFIIHIIKQNYMVTPATEY